MEEESPSPNGGRHRNHRRRHSYSLAMQEENAIEEPEELTRRRSIVARWNHQNSKKKLTAATSHDSNGSSVSSSSSTRRPRSAVRTPSSSTTSRSSSMNEIELPEVFYAYPEITTRLIKPHARKTSTECNCRKDSLASSSVRDSASIYSFRRQDSGYSISTCQSILAPSSARNSVNTLNASQDSRLHQHPNGSGILGAGHSSPGNLVRSPERRHSDQIFANRYANLSVQRRLSDQSLVRHQAFNGYQANSKDKVLSNQRPCCLLALQRREQAKASEQYPAVHGPLDEAKRAIMRSKRPSLVRRDSETSIRSSRRSSIGPVTPKMLRRRFSEQLILEGGLRNEPEFDELVAEDDDPEESLTAANARRRVTLRRHYYPEGNWGYVVTAVALIVHAISHGLQLGFGVLALPTLTRFDKNLHDVGKTFA